MQEARLTKMPSVEEVLQLVDQYPELAQYKTWVPPGHFYSPIPRIEEVLSKKDVLYDEKKPLPGVNLNEKKQVKLFNKLQQYFPGQPFGAKKQEGLRYYFDNTYFPAGDALVLYAMLRYMAPRRVVEVGSGYSSAVMLDTRERFLAKGTELTFIEPNADRLKSILKEGDQERTLLQESVVQEVDMDVFRALEANDFLFIDSSHVSKAGSDVNHLFFEVLPRLNKGVVIHLHDVFYNFEYPLDWITQGRSWNESYLLRAFLQYNTSFEILLFNSYLVKCCPKPVPVTLLARLENTSGSIWLRKVK